MRIITRDSITVVGKHHQISVDLDGAILILRVVGEGLDCKVGLGDVGYYVPYVSERYRKNIIGECKYKNFEELKKGIIEFLASHSWGEDCYIEKFLLKGAIKYENAKS